MSAEGERIAAAEARRSTARLPACQSWIGEQIAGVCNVSGRQAGGLGGLEMNSLKHDDEYQMMRRQFRLIIGADQPQNLADEVLNELVRSHPEPHWVKFESGRMFAINQAYSDKFGIPLIEYIDSYDSNVWSDEEASKFDDNDKAALRAGHPCEFHETVNVDGHTINLKVIKWPLMVEVAGRKIVFIAGKCEERHG